MTDSASTIGWITEGNCLLVFRYDYPMLTRRIIARDNELGIGYDVALVAWSSMGGEWREWWCRYIENVESLGSVIDDALLPGYGLEVDDSVKRLLC